MKKLKTTLLSILVATVIYAQPSLTSDEMLPFGSLLEFNYAENFAIIDTNIKGADVTWDLADLTQLSGQTASIEIVDPEDTPYGDEFPASNYGYDEQYPGVNAYRYFNLTS